MNGMIFLGCSFTWGQGLYYYSKMSTIKRPPPEQFDYKLLTEAHYQYMYANRYPRLVAQHFNTFEVVRKMNGGSEEQNLHFLDEVFSKQGPVYVDIHNQIRNINYDGQFDYNEISYIVLQTSLMQRNHIHFEKDGHKHQLSFFNQSKEQQRFLYEYMEENDINGLPEFMTFMSKKVMNEVKSVFEFYESKGIKCLIWNWSDEYSGVIANDKFLNDRLVTFDYMGKNYKCLDYLIKSCENLFIREDKAFFGNDCPEDSHPSLSCHKIIAESIIKKIENEQTRIHTI